MPVRTASFVADGRYFAVGTNDRSLSICRIDVEFFHHLRATASSSSSSSSPRQQQREPPRPARRVRAAVPELPRAAVTYRLGADSNLLATSGNDKRVRIAHFHDNHYYDDGYGARRRVPRGG